MHGMLETIVARVGAEVDPTIQPVRQSFYVFVFVAVATILLLFSMVRHMRKARANLTLERPQAALPSDEAPAPGRGEPPAGDPA